MASMKSMVEANVGKVVVAVVALLIVSAIVPMAMNAFFDEESATLTQDEDVTYTVAGNLQTNATDVDGTNDEATIELTRTNTGTTVTNTVSNGTTTTYTLDGYDVNVTVDDVDTSTTPNTTTVTYEYPKEAAWDGIVGDLWDLIPIFVIIGLVLLFIYQSLK